MMASNAARGCARRAATPGHGRLALCITAALLLLTTLGAEGKRDLMQKTDLRSQRLRARIAASRAGSMVSVTTTGGTASARAASSSVGIGKTENGVQEIVEDAFTEIEGGSDVEAVVEASAEAIGFAVAQAFSEAEAEVSVTGQGFASAQAESRANVLATATATAIVDAIAIASDGNDDAIASVKVTALASEIAEALSESLAEARTEGGTAFSRQSTFAEAVATPVARALGVAFALLFEGETTAEGFGEGETEVDLGSVAVDSTGESDTFGVSQAAARGRVDALTEQANVPRGSGQSQPQESPQESPPQPPEESTQMSSEEIPQDVPEDSTPEVSPSMPGGPAPELINETPQEVSQEPALEMPSEIPQEDLPDDLPEEPVEPAPETPVDAPQEGPQESSHDNLPETPETSVGSIIPEPLPSPSIPTPAAAPEGQGQEQSMEKLGEPQLVDLGQGGVAQQPDGGEGQQGDGTVQQTQQGGQQSSQQEGQQETQQEGQQDSQQGDQQDSRQPEAPAPAPMPPAFVASQEGECNNDPACVSNFRRNQAQLPFTKMITPDDEEVAVDEQSVDEEDGGSSMGPGDGSPGSSRETPGDEIVDGPTQSNQQQTVLSEEDCNGDQICLARLKRDQSRMNQRGAPTATGSEPEVEQDEGDGVEEQDPPPSPGQRPVVSEDDCNGDPVCLARAKRDRRRIEMMETAGPPPTNPGPAPVEDATEPQESPPAPAPPTQRVSAQDRLASLVASSSPDTNPNDGTEAGEGKSDGGVKESPPPLPVENTNPPSPPAEELNPPVQDLNPTPPAQDTNPPPAPKRSKCRSLGSFCCRNSKKKEGCTCSRVRDTCLLERVEVNEKGQTTAWRDTRNGRECRC